MSFVQTQSAESRLTISGTHLGRLVGTAVQGERADLEVFHLLSRSGGGLERGEHWARGDWGQCAARSNQEEVRRDSLALTRMCLGASWSARDRVKVTIAPLVDE